MAVVADFVDIARSDALLGGDQSLVGWRCSTEKVGFELDHSCAIKEQAFVQASSDVNGDQRSRIVDRVSFALKEAEIFFSQFANGHRFILADWYRVGSLYLGVVRINVSVTK